MSSQDNTALTPTSNAVVKQGHEKCDELFQKLLSPTSSDGSITLNSKDVINLQKAGNYLVGTLSTTLQSVSNLTDAARKNAAAAESNATAAVVHANTINEMRADIGQANARVDSVTRELLDTKENKSNSDLALANQGTILNFLHGQYCYTFYRKYGNPNHKCTPKDNTCPGCVRRECKLQRDIYHAWNEYLINTGCTFSLGLLSPPIPRR